MEREGMSDDARSAGKPLTIRAETVKSVEASELAELLRAKSSVRPFHEVKRNAHPDRDPDPHPEPHPHPHPHPEPEPKPKPHPEPKPHPQAHHDHH